MAAKSTRQSKSKTSCDFLLPEEIADLSALLEDQEAENYYKLAGAKPKKSKSKFSKSSAKVNSAASLDQSASHSVDDLIALETLWKENLAAELKITEAKLELAKLSTSSSSATPPPVSPVQLEKIIAPSSSPGSPVEHFATLEQIRAKKKASTSLPNCYLFSAKGTVEYDKLDLAKFVSGFLEFCKEQPESRQQCLFRHLQLLMDRAITYSWSSVRNFHLSVHNAVDKGRLAWNASDAIRERAQTFFTHQDLRSNTAATPRSNPSSQTRNRAKESYCRDWNYSGKCSCNLSDASYKLVHRCRVCDSTDHAMLTCAKRKYSIPAVQSSSFSSATEQTSLLSSLVHLSDEVRACGAPNAFAAKRPVHSGFNIDYWLQYLEHYEDRIVVDFLRFGWPINCRAHVLPLSTLRNHPSAAANDTCLTLYIAKELDHQSVMGPFHRNPFNSDCVISPLMCVPKRDTDELRIVHDLSFPEGFSVNDGISKDSYLDQSFKLRLPGIDCLVEFINAKGRGCHIFKKDLRRAYRQIPIDPADYRLLGMCINGSIYFHTSLPFGLRSATLICQRTTKSVVHILNNEGISVDVYIDDFYSAESPSRSNQSFQRMNSLFTELGLLASPEKDVPPCHQMLCLGIWIDTLDMTLSVPAFCVSELQKELQKWLCKSSFSRREIQQLLGKLSFVSACVRPGRAFMCRLLNALRSYHSRPKSASFPVTDELHSDIEWWLFLLSHFNGVSVTPSDVVISNPELFATDACLTGCGAVCFGEYFHREFPEFILDKGLHINALELLTVVIAIKLWSLKLAGLRVELLSDNTTCVAVINSQYSTNVFMQRCLRELWLQLALFNIQLVVRSVRGSDNWLADSLSRLHVGEVTTKFHSWWSNPQLSQRHVDDSLFEFAVV